MVMFPEDESFQRSFDDNQNILVAPGLNATEYFIQILGQFGKSPNPALLVFWSF
jgi:hypothetical protein